MADTNNNINNANDATTTSLSSSDEMLTKLSEKVLQAYEKLALAKGIRSYTLSAKPVAGLGENCFGLILQMSIKATETDVNTPKEFINILKMSPKNPAFRAHSRIPQLYRREVFMYEQVFYEFNKLQEARVKELNQINQNCDNELKFNLVPELLHACLDVDDEFIIVEDLAQSDYRQNLRTQMPTFELVSATFRAIAKFHAMSFIMQAKKPVEFQKLVQEIGDNLFTEDIEPVSVEFGKKYIRKTRIMLEQSTKTSVKQIEALQKLEDNFKQICLQCVDGARIEPYAVICHGDFWNNNMLYKYDINSHTSVSAKLIDFQMSRYASPVLDLVHYLYTSTERGLHNDRFVELINIYYQTLTSQLTFYNLKISEIYPREIFSQHLKEFGIFGFCMAAFSIPFFISNTSELPDLDKVANAIRDISSSENSDDEISETDNPRNGTDKTKAKKRLELLEEYDLLTERTLPIFKKRMCGIVKDLEKYEMLESVLQF